MLACGDEDDSSTRCGAIVIFVVKLSSVIKRMLGNAVDITSLPQFAFNNYMYR